MAMDRGGRRACLDDDLGYQPTSWPGKAAWAMPPLPPSCHQRLNTRDCDLSIGELVLQVDVATMFAPTGCDWLAFPFACNDWLPYDATLVLHDGRRVVVRVFKATYGFETRLVKGWRDICEDMYLHAGDLAVFFRAEEDRTFHARFFDAATSNERLSSFGAHDPPSPESQVSFVDADWLRVQGADGGRGEQAAGAHGGERALQRVIKEAMDLAVECGAREGSDEHYMATKLFVKAENRAVFLTFRTKAGRLQWLRRCYEDRMMN